MIVKHSQGFHSSRPPTTSQHLNLSRQHTMTVSIGSNATTAEVTDENRY